MKKIYLVLFLACFVFLTGCDILSNKDVSEATVNCLDQGGVIEMRDDAYDEGEYGVCVFDNGVECDERALLWDECSKEESYANVETEGYDTDLETSMIQEIHSALEDLQHGTKVMFSEIVPVSFEWYGNLNEGIETQTVDGYGYSIEEADVKRDVVDTFFENDGRTSDVYNMADGTIASMVGFTKDGMACQIYSELSDDEEDIESEDFDWNSMNIEVKCGYIVYG